MPPEDKQEVLMQLAITPELRPSVAQKRSPTEPGAVATGCKSSTVAHKSFYHLKCDCRLNVASDRYRSRFCNHTPRNHIQRNELKGHKHRPTLGLFAKPTMLFLNQVLYFGPGHSASVRVTTELKRS
jgi:hypothetical protein